MNYRVGKACSKHQRFVHFIFIFDERMPTNFQCCGSGSAWILIYFGRLYPDRIGNAHPDRIGNAHPELDPGSSKMTHKKGESEEMSCLESWMFSFESGRLLLPWMSFMEVWV
jgi:hypothetical protein